MGREQDDTTAGRRRAAGAEWGAGVWWKDERKSEIPLRDSARRRFPCSPQTTLEEVRDLCSKGFTVLNQQKKR